MRTPRTISFFAVLVIVTVAVTYNSCNKKEETPTNTVPVLSTKIAADITNSSATVGGVVTADGGATVIDRGVCFGTSSNPNIYDDLTIQSGSGVGAFDCSIVALNQSTMYYYRAYAMNSVGIGYGDEKSFTTQGGGGGDLPTVSTSSISNITETTATCGGDVTDQGTSSVTARGVCWSTSVNPTTSDSHTSDGSGTGSFTSAITGLSSSTSYYVKAYATNSAGTAYGNQQSFATSGGSGTGCQGITTITDPRDGQVYPTVEIGNQCWFKENLNVGTRINGNQNQTDDGIIQKYCYLDDENLCDTYGGLYQWNEMMQYVTNNSTKGICPVGWHLPSNAELIFLTDFLGGFFEAGGKMKATGNTYWAPPNSGATNSCGFTGLPGGYRNDVGQFLDMSFTANFWSSSQVEETPSSAYADNLYHNATWANKTIPGKILGLSVRCVKD